MRIRNVRCNPNAPGIERARAWRWRWSWHRRLWSGPALGVDATKRRGVVGCGPVLRSALTQRSGVAQALVVAMLAVLVVPQSAAQSPPEAPSVTQVTPGTGEVAVTWQAPADTGGSAVVAYDLRWIASDAADKSAAGWTVLDSFWSSGPLRGTVTGLVNGVGYDFAVRAVTAGGDGAWSASVSAAPRDSAPTITGVSEGEGVLSVVWSAPPEVADTETVFYNVRWIRSDATDKSDGNWTESGSLPYAQRRWLGIPLDNGVSHDVAVQAQTDHLSAWSTSVSATPADAPDSLTGDAGSVALGVAVSAEISTPPDEDYFKLELSELAVVMLRTSDPFVATSNSRSTAPSGTARPPARYDPSAINPHPDPECVLYDSNGDVIAENDDSFYPNANNHCLIVRKLDAGSYFVRVRSFRLNQQAPHQEGTYLLHAVDVGEPRDTQATAVPLDKDGVTFGDIASNTDVDWISVTGGSADEYFWVEVRPQGVSDGLQVTLIDSADHVRSRTASPYICFTRRCPNTDYPDADFEVWIELPANTTYWLKIESPHAQTPTAATYALTLRRDTDYKRLEDTCKSSPRPGPWEDELSGCQWYLHNDGRNGRTSREDMNILAAHDAGFLGDGVAVQVVDSGIDVYHEDLVDNTNNAADSRTTSLCMNDPAPFTPTARHGTAVAGIAAARDNTLGMRGVAPRAQLYNIRFLTCNALEAGYLGRAMGQNAAKIAVSVNSWGPKDRPAAVATAEIWRKGLEYGLQAGFGGKGTAYVFAAGNGHALDGTPFYDYATLEEFVTHRGTIPVCAVDATGRIAWYSERGPNLWVCGPGNDGRTRIGSPPNRYGRWGIATTDLQSRYRVDFGGTSAAAPAVGGVVALMRAANPDLTWRDVKLILAESARRNDPTDSGWAEGAAKYGDSSERYWFNNMYGFGMVDAYAAVQSAQNWTLLPPMLTSTSTAAGGPLTIPGDRSAATSTVTVGDQIEFVEYVEINTNFDADDFRHLRVELISPSGTVSLLSPAIDYAAAVPLKEAYRFGSAKHLGESAAGNWTLRITDRFATRNKGTAVLTDWSLAVYGNRRHPSAPTLSSVTAAPASLVVAWQAPSQSGATALTGYELRHISSTAADKTDDTRWDVAAVPGGAATLTHTLSFATVAGSRDVQVRAVNSAGAGPWSATVTGTPGAAANFDAHFADASTTRTIAENTAAGAAVGAAVTAVDSDTAPLTYTLSGSGADSFTIDSATGQLRTKAALDYETQAAYSVTVSVSDGLNFANEADPSTDDSIDVAIEVVDVDEPHSQTCTPAGKPAANGDWVLAEPLPAGVGAAGRLAVGNCAVADPEGGSVSWQVTGPDRLLFGVDAAGTVSFNNDPDYEAPGDAGRDNIHNITVTAAVGVHTSSVAVTVQVTDVDEPPTISPRSCVFSVAENTRGGWGCGFAVSDAEGRTLKEELTGPDASSFDLNPFTLSDGTRALRVLLKSSVVLDYETKAVYEVAVEVTDSGPASHTVSFDISLAVTEVDESLTPTIQQPVVNNPRPPVVNDPRPPVVNDPRPPVVNDPRPPVVNDPRPPDETDPDDDDDPEDDDPTDGDDDSEDVDPTDADDDDSEDVDPTDPDDDDDSEDVDPTDAGTGDGSETSAFGDAGPDTIRPARVAACESGPGDANTVFTDVAETSFAYNDVACIYALEVTTGTGATTYSPRDPVTRAQMASFLARLYERLNGAAAPVVATPFTDVAKGSSASDDVGRIYGLKNTTGTSDTTYSPTAPVTRAQMASFLARLYERLNGAAAPVVATPFTDVAKGSSASDDVGRIYGLKITTGTSDTTYSPTAPVTREQMAKFLANLYRSLTA